MGLLVVIRSVALALNKESVTPTTTTYSSCPPPSDESDNRLNSLIYGDDLLTTVSFVVRTQKSSIKKLLYRNWLFSTSQSGRRSEEMRSCCCCWTNEMLSGWSFTLKYGRAVNKHDFEIAVWAALYHRYKVKALLAVAEAQEMDGYAIYKALMHLGDIEIGHHHI